jgi:hypothetical protein
MKLKQASALEGMRWMRQGVQLAYRQPLTFAGLMGFMLFGLGLLLALPLVGPVLVGVLMPTLSAGWVLAVETHHGGRRPTPLLLLQPLTLPTRTPLLILGALHAVAVTGVLWLADIIDPDLQDAWRTAMGGDAAGDLADEARLSAMQALQSGMLLRLVAIVPVALVFWHAPVILLREGGSVPRALFASALASFRNLGAFVVYALSWAAADLTLSVVLGGLLALLGLAQWAVFFAMPVALFFSAAFYASLHASVHGCLDFSATDTPSAQPLADTPVDRPPQP